MAGAEVNPHPIRLMVNYWEIPQAALKARLEELQQNGFSHVATFLPWQAVESDISHSLTRLLQAISERHMSVSMIVTPELGVHYPNSGLPKDLLSKPDAQARNFRNGKIGSHLPPNSFALPSLIGSEFTKRYQNYLTRLDTLLGDLGRLHSQVLDDASVVLTGSYWKYLRSSQDTASSVFGGSCGDYSPGASLNYRQKIEKFFSQKEFNEPNASAAQRWKTKAMEESNRRWYHQSCEEVFRARSSQFLSRRARLKTISQVELFTPEADPAYVYSAFLQTVSGGKADLQRFSTILDEIAQRSAFFDGKALPPYVHWTGFGTFRTLSDSEKQFLILKSLLLTASQGGGIYIDDREWFALSPTFRNRAENLAKAMARGDLQWASQVLYLASSLWSNPGKLFDEVQEKVPADLRLVSSAERVQRESQANLVIVDPNFLMTRENVLKLVGWVSSSQNMGRVLAMPRSSYFTEAAKDEIDQTISKTNRLEVQLGLSYQICSIGEGGGKLVLYEPSEKTEDWQTFLQSILSLANVNQICHVSDGRLKAVSLRRSGHGYGLFILNSSNRPVSADLIFPSEVMISDLGSYFLSTNGPQELSHPDPEEQVGACRYAMDVPPHGILPLGVDGFNLAAERVDIEERRAAGLVSESLSVNVGQVAVDSLPEYQAQEDIGSLWS